MKRKLRCTVFESEGTRRERRPTRVRPCPLRGRGCARAACSMAGGHGAHDQGARRHDNTRDSVEKNAGRVGELTGATKTVRTARFGPLACDGSRRSSASSYAVRTESGREGKWGGESARARGSAHLKPRHGVGRRGDRGRGLRLGGSKLRQRERGKTGERLGEIELTGGPGLSVGGRERKGEVSS